MKNSIAKGFIRTKVNLLILAVIGFSCSEKSETQDPESEAQIVYDTPKPTKDTPEGMAWIPGGEFTMGKNEADAYAAEKPAVRLKVEGFWMDTHEVTNAEFAEFVEQTGYVTMAERPVEWEELKKQLPPGTPKPDDSLLVPGSLVFTPPASQVPLQDISLWWTWSMELHGDIPKVLIPT